MTAADSRPRVRGHRAHRQPGRTKRVTLRYAESEYAAIEAAASAAGLTPTGYTAQAALAQATGQLPPQADPAREALLELMLARSQVRRFAVNVNQAVRELKATGTPPSWLAHAVVLTSRAVTRLDEAAASVTAASRGRRSATRAGQAPTAVRA